MSNTAQFQKCGLSANAEIHYEMFTLLGALTIQQFECVNLADKIQDAEA